MREAAPALVVPNESIATRQRGQPVPPHRAAAVIAEVGHPVRGLDQGWPGAGQPVRDPDPVLPVAEPDVFPHRRAGLQHDAGATLRRERVRRDRVRRDRVTHELVSPPTDRTDPTLGLPVVGERSTGSLDPRGQRRVADEPAAPHLVEKLRLGDHPVSVLDEVTEHVEDLRLHVHLSSRSPQLETERIQGELSERVHPSRLCRPAAPPRAKIATLRASASTPSSRRARGTTLPGRLSAVESTRSPGGLHTRDPQLPASWEVAVVRPRGGYERSARVPPRWRQVSTRDARGRHLRGGTQLGDPWTYSSARRTYSLLFAPPLTCAQAAGE